MCWKIGCLAYVAFMCYDYQTCDTGGRTVGFVIFNNVTSFYNKINKLFKLIIYLRFEIMIQFMCTLQRVLGTQLSCMEMDFKLFPNRFGENGRFAERPKLLGLRISTWHTEVSKLKWEIKTDRWIWSTQLGGWEIRGSIKDCSYSRVLGQFEEPVKNSRIFSCCHYNQTLKKLIETWKAEAIN